MKKHIYKTGDTIQNRAILKYEGIIIPPNKYVVATILKDGKVITHYGVITETPLAGWGNLGGVCPSNCGMWLPLSFVDKYFVAPEFGRKMFIREEFIFKKRNLKDKKCRLISSLPRSEIAFVELDEFVDGCSADGLGKAGHCILIPRKYLKKEG